jgi:hypothetical protein
MMHIGVESSEVVNEEKAHKKTPFVAALSLNEEGHPIKMKMTVVEGFRTDVISTRRSVNL